MERRQLPLPGEICHVALERRVRGERAEALSNRFLIAGQKSAEAIVGLRTSPKGRTCSQRQRSMGFIGMAAQQLHFDWDRPVKPEGEAQRKAAAVCQMSLASCNAEPVNGVTMEEVVRKENLVMALKRVCANKGRPGIDKMTVNDLKDLLTGHWPSIRQQLLSWQFEPQPVKRVMIPKPGGGSRMLGIPTVLDRFIQHRHCNRY